MNNPRAQAITTASSTKKNPATHTSAAGLSGSKTNQAQTKSEDGPAVSQRAPGSIECGWQVDRAVCRVGDEPG